MNRELEQYRFARIEGYRLTQSRLQEQFMEKAVDLDGLERTVRLELSTTAPLAPWRKSEMEQVGCREGRRLAALEFFWENHQAIRLALKSIRGIGGAQPD